MFSLGVSGSVIQGSGLLGFEWVGLRSTNKALGFRVSGLIGFRV